MDHQPFDQAQPKLWIISSAQYSRSDFSSLGLGNISQTVREYRISAIGHYLVSPSPLNVSRRLVGCEIHWRPSFWDRWRMPILKVLGRSLPTGKSPKILLTDFHSSRPLPDNEGLNTHVRNMQAKMRTYDSLFQALDEIDLRLAVNVVGICEDDAGNRSQLMIEGDLSQKLDYVRTSAGRQINVRLKCAQFADGLFEMKGFDFPNYDPQAAYRLIRFVHEGRPRACVVNDDNRLVFWLDDPKLVNYLQLFEFSIQQNHHMRDSLQRCIQSKAVPMRLMFNHALEIDYSQAPLPMVFKEIIGDHPLGEHASRLIKENLNHQQVGVSFNSYSSQTTGRGGGVCTDISIFQNLRALEPIKQHLPQLFAGMTQRANRSDEGHFYLLDAIRGVPNGT